MATVERRARPKPHAHATRKGTVVDIDIHQLEYFTCAARTGSYSRAARELFVTPQAISRSIQLLEARLGVQLFRRTSSGIDLTPAGSACLESTLEALASLRRLQDTAARHRPDVGTTIVLGIHSLCFRENGGSIDRTALLAFQKRHSTLTLSFVEMTGNAIIDALRDGAIDVGITVPPRDIDAQGASDLERHFLKSFCIAAIVSQEFARAYVRAPGTVSVEELVHGELILFSDETGYNGSLIAHANLAEISLPVSALRISPHGDMGFIAGSHLYAVRPLQHAQRTIHDERLRVLPIHDATGKQIRMPLELLMRRDRAHPAAEEELLALIEACYR